MQIVDAPGSLRPEPVQATSSVGALVRFHASAGGRVASRNAIATIGLIIIVLGSAPDPFVWLRFLALGVAARGPGSGPLNGLAATVVQDNEALSCQPCQSTICKMNDHRCMRDIEASEVADIAQRVMAQAPPSN